MERTTFYDRLQGETECTNYTYDRLDLCSTMQTTVTQSDRALPGLRGL